MAHNNPKYPFIVGLGVCCEDRIGLIPAWPSEDDGVHLKEYTRQCGGMVATALAAASKLGISTALLSMAGNDDSGLWLKKEMSRQGVDVSQFILKSGFPTPFSIILVNAPDGHRRIFHYRPVEYQLGSGEVNLEIIRHVRFLHLDGHFMDLAIEAAREAHRRGVKVCLDAWKPYPNMEKLIPLVDYLICNRHFPLIFTGKKDLNAALGELARVGPELSAASLGKDGLLALYHGEFLQIPSSPVQVVDTTGAGDVLHGAFLAGLCKDKGIQEALRYACAAASLSCQSLGGQGALPTHREVMNLLVFSEK